MNPTQLNELKKMVHWAYTKTKDGSRIGLRMVGHKHEFYYPNYIFRWMGQYGIDNLSDDTKQELYNLLIGNYDPTTKIQPRG